MKLIVDDGIGGLGPSNIDEEGRICLTYEEADLTMKISAGDLLDAINTALDGNLIEFRMENWGEDAYLAEPGADRADWVVLLKQDS